MAAILCTSRLTQGDVFFISTLLEQESYLEKVVGHLWSNEKCNLLVEQIDSEDIPMLLIALLDQLQWALHELQNTTNHWNRPQGWRGFSIPSCHQTQQNQHGQKNNKA